jgi:hypothetical protein
MASWRDTTSQQAQDDLDGLLGAALPFAEQMLERSREFFPFAVGLSGEGETRVISGLPDAGIRPESTVVRSLLLDVLRHERDGVRAAAVVCDVRLADSDAVRVELEHIDGVAIAVALPYTKKRFRGFGYGDIRAVSSDERVEKFI